MSIKKQELCLSPAQTRKIGREFAKNVLNVKQTKSAFVFGLSGSLGSGKTVFSQGFAKGLGIKEKITSPTFTIINKFRVPNPKQGFLLFYHIDCYRIERPKEMLELGFKEIIQDQGNIVLIEWPEKIKAILPQNTVWLEFKFKGKNKRKIIIQ